ncbi:hypothetical protein BDF14DRAFT_1798798 [Spinellus fusiger]|nr:hypothetical protein BDF14DRAFT_1798715 [Spinellus fusiger]KAI7868015.1 hypothetical protein BDF14DRAFT_1798798 [Spinellus fusiger]
MLKSVLILIFALASLSFVSAWDNINNIIKLVKPKYGEPLLVGQNYTFIWYTLNIHLFCIELTCA